MSSDTKLEKGVLYVSFIVFCSFLVFCYFNFLLFYITVREDQKRHVKGEAAAVEEGHVAAESTWRSGSSFDPSVTGSTEALAASETVMNY